MKTTLHFDRDLYAAPAIMRAVQDYAELAHILVTEDADGYVCQITGTQAPEELVCREFSNYVLELTVHAASSAELA